MHRPLYCSTMPPLTSSAKSRVVFNVVCVNLQAVREFLGGIKQDLGLDVYSFSIFHVFFEQYLTIGREALVMLAFATAAVTLIVLVFTASVWASALTCIVLIMILVCPYIYVSPSFNSH